MSFITGLILVDAPGSALNNSGADERARNLEYELFQKLREETLGELGPIQRTADAIAYRISSCAAVGSVGCRLPTQPRNSRPLRRVTKRAEGFCSVVGIGCGGSISRRERRYVSMARRPKSWTSNPPATDVNATTGYPTPKGPS